MDFTAGWSVGTRVDVRGIIPASRALAQRSPVSRRLKESLLPEGRCCSSTRYSGCTMETPCPDLPVGVFKGGNPMRNPYR